MSKISLFYLVSGYKYNDSETSENSETADFLIYDPQKEKTSSVGTSKTRYIGVL